MIPQRPLSPAEKTDWLRLIRSANVGPITFWRLMESFGTASAALDALPRLARRGGGTARVPSRAEAERELAAYDRLGARLVAAVEPDYPAPLRAIEDAPPLIGMLGAPHLLKRPCVALVGARNASANGRKLARQIAAELAGAGMTVVSGMARGIDTAAHEGALAGGTVAVLAGGLDVIYPRENAGLYRGIVEQGAVVAELPPGTEPQASHFPRRNRLISGLSLGVVVVEAAARSGSLITARRALDQGREVFAVPGSPLDPRARGPNSLIRQGAVLTEGAGDVLEALNDLLRRPLAEPPTGAPAPAPAAVDADDAALVSARRAVLEALGPAPVAVDELVRQCQLSPAVTSTVLLELELAGRLERHPGNQVSLNG